MEEQQLATILWRGKALIALCLVVAIAGAVVATARSPKVYQATAILQVGPGNVPRSGADSALATQQASQSLAKQYANLLSSRSFLERLRAHLPGAPSTDALQSGVDARAIEETGLIELSAEGSSPRAATRLARSIANEFIGLLQSDARSLADQQQTQAEARISSIAAKLRALRLSDTQRAALEAERAAVTEQLASGLARTIAQGVSLAAPPTAEDAPIRPRLLLNLVAGILLGLLVGIGAAWLRARLEHGLKSSAEAQKTLGLPVLASIPLRRWFSPHDPVLAEAFEVLRSNILFSFERDSAHVVVIASYSSGEGKTSTAHGLACAAVRATKTSVNTLPLRPQVLVIDGDLRTRELSTQLGHGWSPGLSALAAGQLSVDEAIHDVAPGFSLLPAGLASTNAPGVLDSAFTRELIGELRERYKLILIDSPGTANLADAGILASLSDGVVMVARVGRTKREDLHAAMLNLGHSRTSILGVVVLEPRSIDGKYFAGQPAAVSADAPAPAAFH
jgi:Mrp family chromosome partitioning ATPase